MSVDSSRAGLPPAEARAWIDFQRRFAWIPEVVGPLLEAGSSVEALLARSSSLPGSAKRPEPVRWSLDAEIARLEALEVRILPRMLPGYPEGLTNLSDAPGVLFVRGSTACLRKNCLAIVGARAATQSARQTARRLGRELAARGVTIVSGLARGIDAAAHEGALEGGGTTVAVMASGIEEIYPPEHRRLAEEIVRNGGALVSEMPMGSPPRRAHFPLRNRLISGLSSGVVVVEARRRSGSLITVRHALSQGREVFVVPGAVGGPFAEGTNQLLRDGARPVLGANDVLEDLGWGRPPRLRAVEGREAAAAFSQEASDWPQTVVLQTLEAGPVSRQELADRLPIAPGLLAQILLELELVGRVIEDRDGRLQLNWG